MLQVERHRAMDTQALARDHRFGHRPGLERAHLARQHRGRLIQSSRASALSSLCA